MTYVAFDTSKETIAVALAEGGRRGEVRFFGTVANRPESVRKLVDNVGLTAKADLWLRERPGTDGALALGIASVMIERGWYDRVGLVGTSCRKEGS